MYIVLTMARNIGYLYNIPIYFLIFLIIISILIYFRPLHKESLVDGSAKIAIVSMMKNPKNIDQWLKKHRDLGISKFYIRLEESDDILPLLKAPDIYVESGKSTGVNEYLEIQTRQIEWVNKALEMAKKDDITWLIHIDSDEILSGNLDEIRGLDASVSTFWMQNVEAKYAKIPRKSDSCFQAAKFVNCGKDSEPCVSYVNGKGGGRTNVDVKAFGPHRFKSDSGGKEVKLKMLVQHYESCDFETYKKKYLGLSLQNKKNDIPFTYYNESIDAAKEGDEELERVFTKYRVL
jgi:hypothetical protein